MEEENQGKCIKQPVVIVVKNAKYHLDLIQAGLFTAKIVGPKEDPQEDLNIENYSTNLLAMRVRSLLLDGTSFLFER